VLLPRYCVLGDAQQVLKHERCQQAEEANRGGQAERRAEEDRWTTDSGQDTCSLRASTREQGGQSEIRGQGVERRTAEGGWNTGSLRAPTRDKSGAGLSRNPCRVSRALKIDRVSRVSWADRQ
jgi:hypothetical protein